MRFYNTEKSLNENIHSEIEFAIVDAQRKYDNLLSIKLEDGKIKLAIDIDYEYLKTQKEIIINTYYDDLKTALLGKLSTNTEKTNSIYIGKYQPSTLTNLLMIEGTVSGVNNIILSGMSYGDIKEITHDNVFGEMQLMTHNYFYQMMKEINFNPEENIGWDAFSAIYEFYHHVTRLYLHLAIDKLYKEGIFDLHLKIRPFHIYFGEPNHLYNSVYYLDK